MLKKRVWNDDKKVWLIPNNQKSIDVLLQNLYSLKIFSFQSVGSEKTVEAYVKWVKFF